MERDPPFPSPFCFPLRCYRTDIADTIMYCFNILRDNLLHQLLGHLDNAIAQCNANNAQNWPYLGRKQEENFTKSQRQYK